MEGFTIKPLSQNVSSLTTLKYVLIACVSLLGAFGCSSAPRVQIRQSLAPSLKKQEEDVNVIWEAQTAILLNYRQTLSAHVPAPPPSVKPIDIAMNDRNDNLLQYEASVLASEPTPQKSLSTFADCHEEEVAGTSVCFMQEPILLEDPMIEADCADSASSWCLPAHEESFLSYLAEQKSQLAEQEALKFAAAIVPNFVPPVEDGLILRGMQKATKKKKRGHYGVDIVPSTFERHGTEIKSIEDGVVVLASRGRGYGYYTVIYHQNGLFSLYSHILEKGRAKAGETVKRGEVIGLMGKTGNARGYHLHFELIDLRETWNLQDSLDEFARKIILGQALPKCEYGQFSKLLFAKTSKIDPVAYIPNIARAQRVNGKWVAVPQIDAKKNAAPLAKTKKKK